ncbi:DNA polymerase lambda [Mycena olivaceomarginata]|nr:DNA polymerase lambda [Mycena olivaceomarginata]
MPTQTSPYRPAPTSRRASPLPSIPPKSPDDKPVVSKRKESPTKPDKPARKKAAIDPSPVPFSPIELSPEPVSRKPLSKKPPSTKPKSSNKAVRPSVKIPPALVPEIIDLSTQSPIEEPDFSVLVSRFEPEATSTQPPVAAARSLFLETKERMEQGLKQNSRMQREKKQLKAASKAGRRIAGPSNNVQSDAISGDESSIVSVSSSSRPSSPEHNRKPTNKSSAKVKPKPKTAAPLKMALAKKGKAEKVKMLPHEYAQMLVDQSNEPLDPAVKSRRKWASITTMGRMDLIMKHGGTLVPHFDSALVTHIISEASPIPTLRALGLQKLKEVPPQIPIVKWTWVLSGFISGVTGPLWEYAAFSHRIPPLDFPPRNLGGKGKQRAVADPSADVSHIPAVAQAKKQREQSIPDSEDDDDGPSQKPGPQGPLPSPPSSPSHQASSSRVKAEPADDPLAEFYAQARADRDNAFARHGEAEEPDETDVDEALSDSDDEVPTGPPPKRGWTVDSKEVQRKNGPNEFIVKKLEELMMLHKAKPGMDDHWRAFSYQKSSIMEIIETGELRRIGYENTEDVQIRAIFQGIYGVGQATAYKWYAAGCRSLEDLEAGKGGVTLTDAQKIGIQFYDDINDRMPREEAQALFDIIKPIALGIDPEARGPDHGQLPTADCGDIDIMITRCPDDGKTHAGILHHLLKALHEAKIITEDLALPDNPFDDEAIYRGLLPPSAVWSRGAALLYYTGDDIRIRLGYSLNQKGLHAGVVRDPRNRLVKFNTGNIVASETEEEIFHMLGVPFQQPHERVRG